MKPCIHCRVVKDLSDFYKHAQMRDGHLNVCKPCYKEHVRRHREANDSVREYDRRRYHTREKHNPRYLKLKAANVIAHQKRHPEAIVAYSAVAHAIKMGKLVRQPCEDCGKPSTTNEPTHAHHDDYSKPLDVRWKCVRCHARHHSVYTTA